MGGYWTKVGIYWQIRWSKLGDKIVQDIKCEEIGINVLSLAAILVNYLAVIFAFLTQDHDMHHQLRIHIGDNNTTADAWYKKFSNPNEQACQLTKILNFLIKNSNVGMYIEHIAWILNFFANSISRGIFTETLDPLFKHKWPSNSGAFSCLQVPSLETKISFKRFLPSADMLSGIFCALLQQNMPSSLPHNPKAWGHCTLDNNVFFEFLNKWV